MFRPSVERWRGLLAPFSGDAPVDYVLDWMDKESGGNRCNLTTSAGFPEVGLLQLDPGNMAVAGTTQDVLRSGCNGQTDVGTDDDRLTAVSTGIDYVNALKALAHQKLKAVGVDWDESDPGFWALVRLQHAAGNGAVDSWLHTATTNLGSGPRSWDEFIASGCCGTTSQAYFNKWTSVAAENGSWATGFSGAKLGKFGIFVALMLGIGLGVYLLERAPRLGLVST